LKKVKGEGIRREPIQAIHDHVDWAADLLEKGQRPFTKQRAFGSRLDWAHGIEKQIVKIDIL
jgi:hypothetical protein